MIERKFVKEKIKEFQIKEFIDREMPGMGHSTSKLQKTPLGDKVTIHTSRPGLVVGRGGANITSLTKSLKKKFNLDNPQLEISEVENPNLDPNIIAERIMNSLERFGTQRFKGVGHKAMADVLSAGGKGVEILISGRVPSMRARRWRFYQGYLKKCGDVVVSGDLTAKRFAKLKSGVVGIQVTIMPPNIRLPDDVKIIEKPQVEEVEEVEDIKDVKKVEKKKDKPKKGKKEKPDKNVKKTVKKTKTVKKKPKKETKVKSKK